MKAKTGAHGRRVFAALPVAVALTVAWPAAEGDEGGFPVLALLCLAPWAAVLGARLLRGKDRDNDPETRFRALQSQISALTYENEALKTDLEALRGGSKGTIAQAFRMTMQSLHRQAALAADEIKALKVRLTAEETRRKGAESQFAGASAALLNMQKDLAAERAARREAEARVQAPSDDLKAFTFNAVSYEDALLLLGLTKGGFTAKDLRKRWRDLQTRCHPDHGGTNGLSAIVTHAYGVVSRFL